MVDLSTEYMGLKLKNPLVASSSPLSQDMENLRRMEESGIAAVVMYSLFEEQITAESKELNRYLVQGTESFAESLTYLPDFGNYKIGPDDYLKHIENAKKLIGIPVIGSLNGVSTGGWTRYAKLIEEAGADALELNTYYLSTSTDITSGQIEKIYIDLVKNIRNSISIPIAVKLSPFFSSIPNMAFQLIEAGANALVLFNRFYQPDLDIEAEKVVPNLVLSTSEELRMRLRWVAILEDRIKTDMAITGGVHTVDDVVKSIMAGAKVAMMTSALLKNGISHITLLIEGLTRWLEEHHRRSVRHLQGVMSQRSVADPAAFERANYMKTLASYKEI
ncbi:MAG: dihydroorotate dehydrogenase-like protein [Candidatus Margulisiibacteriota bacterium]|nr:MAG: dihydroorotate dehydrogenase [Candidatus Margulisbacteria bacterium GWD2_39_127]OGI01641.1 MAG: dihydroorotate dehydrogenase [Candidatus Margulisbacteria bacterium GWF2_38_17]OGI06899.1 MAG: dihydroorotate dehydrogenase [Candidatus Margulisbacteria bacterium GWE2_39_32]PZM83873.1 MAG: dihydroorotate dehydrogenase-like protein [Candidatus Margulisiibacteriota bacterium]HAR63604.1 dihydroorotate dehydrogenase-like protein [Candidatus Margulisiibacteriota bacterium]